MAVPTPWQTKRALPQSVPRLLPLGRLRATWPYAIAAVGSVAVFFMLFQTWMVTPNWSGFNAVDAFGTTHTTTTHINLWSQEQPPGTSVTGIWGILTTISVFVTVFAAIQAIYRGTRTPGLVTTGAATAVALFVIIDLFYIRSKQIPVQITTGMGNDLGAQMGLVIMAMRGSGAYPWPGVKYVLDAAHMTSWAFSTAAVAFGTAGVAATRTWYGGLHGVALAVGRGWTHRQARSIGQWLSDERSRVSAPRTASPTSAAEPIEPAEDRDWGAAG
ncbi:hypothetical protein [Nocardia alni]|uniref:hypothetical protein n=1 Tax=Nocardia alni TaxID=2815723 RepID=UPI001C22A0D2|nr:hypothetical protein [Nocardia alni]